MTATMSTGLHLTRRARNALLTVHIAASVALLGDVLGLTAIALSARGAEPAAAHAGYETMSMFSLMFGIPLSFVSLVTGIVLGVGTRWGVLKHWWVTAKLVALIAVMAVGALVVGPAEGRLIDAPLGTGSATDEWIIVGGALGQATLLIGATALSVYKPGGRRGAARRAGHTPTIRDDDAVLATR